MKGPRGTLCRTSGARCALQIYPALTRGATCCRRFAPDCQLDVCRGTSSEGPKGRKRVGPAVRPGLGLEHD